MIQGNGLVAFLKRLLAHRQPPLWLAVGALLARVPALKTGIVADGMVLCALASSAGSGGTAETVGLTESNAVRVYTINRKVSDFPDTEDVSTPEAAYATLNRLCASGATEPWNRLTAPWLREGLPTEKREVPDEAARDYLGAELLEVQLWHKTNGVVLARVGDAVDLRWLCSVDGRWLNEGRDGAPDLEEARELIGFRHAYRDSKPLREQAERRRNSRPPVADPEKRLRPFVEFLKRRATAPQDFLQKALQHHRLVILGEVHNRPRYWAFYTALVRLPGFVRQVGVIYLEWPHNDQPFMDRFLTAPHYDPAPLIDALRDMNEVGWPDQPTVEFCRAVWELNQSLPERQRLRVVLVDKAEPWKEIQKREDWGKYDLDRNKLMARLVVSDLREHAQDSRQALFIVGYMHALKKATYPGGFPFKSAAWHLRK
jgi:hypothetical protein